MTLLHTKIRTALGLGLPNIGRVALYRVGVTLGINRVRRNAIAMLRYPRFKFRPSQADALHVDLWVDGENLLRDARAYSYNPDPQWLAVMGVPCITVCDTTERPETVTIGTNELIGTDPARLGPSLGNLFEGQWERGGVPELWDGHAGKRIAAILERLL